MSEENQRLTWILSDLILKCSGEWAVTTGNTNSLTEGNGGHLSDDNDIVSTVPSSKLCKGRGIVMAVTGTSLFSSQRRRPLALGQFIGKTKTECRRWASGYFDYLCKVVRRVGIVISQDQLASYNIIHVKESVYLLRFYIWKTILDEVMKLPVTPPVLANPRVLLICPMDKCDCENFADATAGVRHIAPHMRTDKSFTKVPVTLQCMKQEQDKLQYYINAVGKQDNINYPTTPAEFAEMCDLLLEMSNDVLVAP